MAGEMAAGSALSGPLGGATLGWSHMRISRREFVIGNAAGLASPAAGAAASQGGPALTWRCDHDLNLPAWGPYTKKYYGISHIADPRRGLRFDLGIFPGFYRRTPLVPNVLWESGYHPWEASPDLEYYAVRYEIEWKDQVYCDASFSPLTQRARLVRCELVNRTDLPQSLALHYVASLHYPQGAHQVDLPAGAVWVDALDYQDLEHAHPRPTDHLVPDGLLRDEIRDPAFVGGGGIGKRFGWDAGDRAAYTLTLREPVADAVLLVRYRVAEGAVAAFDVEGLATGRLPLPGAPGISIARMHVGPLAAGTHPLRLRSLGAGAADLDGFAIVSRAAAGEVRFRPVPQDRHPQLTAGPSPTSVVLQYPGLPHAYGIAWGPGDHKVREFFSGEMDSFFRFNTHQHVLTVIKGTGAGHYTDVFLRPVTLAPRSRRVLYAVVAAGAAGALPAELALPDEARSEHAYYTARARAAEPPSTPEGRRYTFGQRLMAVMTLTNVVYPIYARRAWIRHNTPGRFFDSLYTWDSGFIGLGLMEYDAGRAADCLSAYLTEPGDSHAPFLHHGTPLATQIYLFQELWNRTQSPEVLRYFYPRVRQMYRFLAGRAEGSTARPFSTGLIATWDYFYNTGWDDYPAQMHVHARKLEKSAAAPVSTAHAIRTAKILRMAALALGLREDVAAYDEDVRVWTEALQRYSWDEESGYYGYVLHDAASRPTGILRDPSGVNFNMAMGGASPLIAGICTPAQERRLAGHLFSERRLWTPIGLSTVDQSAPYYRRDGYWNGAVWMPHQWFFWKALLDCGRAAEARRIARTALEVWSREVEASYNCFEHFLVENGRGAGWHQFSGLSTPVLCWFGAYHRPGRLTAGFDTRVRKAAFDRDCRSLDAELELHGGRRASVIVTMQPGSRYAATWGGAPQEVAEVYPGVLEMDLEPAVTGRVLAVRER